MRYLAAFARFWWDFVVGEDWRIAAGVLAALGLGALLAAGGDVADGAIAVVVTAGIVAALAVSLFARPLTKHK